VAYRFGEPAAQDVGDHDPSSDDHRRHRLNDPSEDAL
jgi:hypothetical protein